jgi:hypothetical protein
LTCYVNTKHISGLEGCRVNELEIIGTDFRELMNLVPLGPFVQRLVVRPHGHSSPGLRIAHFDTHWSSFARIKFLVLNISNAQNILQQLSTDGILPELEVLVFHAFADDLQEPWEQHFGTIVRTRPMLRMHVLLRSGGNSTQGFMTSLRAASQLHQRNVSFGLDTDNWITGWHQEGWLEKLQKEAL